MYEHFPVLPGLRHMHVLPGLCNSSQCGPLKVQVRSHHSSIQTLLCQSNSELPFLHSRKLLWATRDTSQKIWKADGRGQPCSFILRRLMQDMRHSGGSHVLSPICWVTRLARSCSWAPTAAGSSALLLPGSDAWRFKPMTENGSLNRFRAWKIQSQVFTSFLTPK